MAEWEKKVRKVLSEHGFIFHRHAKGDHDMWINPKTNSSVSVDGKIYSRHTANGILKKAGIDFKF